jgi:pyrroline-5-carboxylate reductase
LKRYTAVVSMSGAVGILGWGKVASALAEYRRLRPDPESELLAHGETMGLTEGPAGDAGGVASVSLKEMAARARLVIVEGEPQDSDVLFGSLRPFISDDMIVVSVVSGVSLRGLREAVGPGPALFRVVANPGIGRGKGVTVLCPEAGATPASVASVARVLDCTGTVEVVPEDMLSAAVAVTGSSIGFLALALEGIEEGAVQAGLPRDTARAFVRQTALTTALLLQNHPGSPADLKDQVASPAGTTIAGLAALEDQAVRGAYIRAMEQASGKYRTPGDVGASPVVE